MQEDHKFETSLENLDLLKIKFMKRGLGEMAQWLRVLVQFLEPTRQFTTVCSSSSRMSDIFPCTDDVSCTNIK